MPPPKGGAPAKGGDEVPAIEWGFGGRSPPIMESPGIAPELLPCQSNVILFHHDPRKTYPTPRHGDWDGPEPA